MLFIFHFQNSNPIICCNPHSHAQIVDKVIDEGYRMPPPRGCPDKLYRVMMSCWMTDPQDRPTFISLRDTLDNFYA